jgi:hypothetical protein
MGKLWISGSGGAGSGSDECTASKLEVLKGYSAITSDSDDEVIQGTLELTADASDGQVLSGKTYYNTNPKNKRTGTMTNQGTVSVKLNAGEGYTVPSGFHNGGGRVEANGLANQTPGNAEVAHILSGKTAWVNGTKVNGGIPWQNAEVSGTDRARATNMSNWAGTINLGVRSGYYLNGVNWVQQDIPNYQPANIKKGVNIGGVVGTFEGYVPTSTDLYLRGNNIGGWTINSSGGGTLESGGMRMLNKKLYVNTTNQYNLSGFNYLNLEIYFDHFDPKYNQWNSPYMYGELRPNANRSTNLATVATGIISNNNSYILNFNVSNLHLTTNMQIEVGINGNCLEQPAEERDYWTTFSMFPWTGWCFRIWLS